MLKPMATTLRTLIISLLIICGINIATQAADSQYPQTTISAANQANLSQQVNNLQVQNQSLNNQLQQLSTQLDKVNKQLNPPEMAGVSPNSFAGMLEAWADGFMDAVHGNTGFWVAVACIGLAAIVLIWLALQPKTGRSATSTKQNTANDDDTASEYDYLASEEALPAKLDLARAYIAMEDFTQAKKVLADIIGSQCGEDYKSEAKEILEEMAAKQ